MNVEAYIASGILEAYAQGQLSAAERAEVQKNMLAYPQLRKELAVIEETQEALLQRMAIKPKASSKVGVLKRIEGRERTRFFSDTTEEPFAWKWIAAAAVVFAVGASYLAFDYRGRWKTTARELTNLIAQNQQISKDYNTVNERLDRLEVDLNIVNNPAFTRVIMKGTDQAPSALAAVYWNETSKEVYLSIQELKDLSAEKQYQLWAIIDGKPVDAGVFDLTKGRLLRMKSVNSGAVTFAVTIEPKGGRPTPSLETMQAAGNVVKG